MGIRIHKILGYGLTDVQADTEAWEITDPRFNKDGYLFDHDEEKFSVDGFKAYLTNQILSATDEEDQRFDLKLILRGLSKNKDDMYSRPINGLYDCVNYDMEFGDPKVLMIVPPSCTKEWSRYDDAIDYYDPVNQSADGGIEPSIIELNRPLWPWDTYSSIKTMPPKPVPYEVQWGHSLIKNGHIEIEDDEYAKKLGYDSAADMDANIVPTIPLEVVELLKYLKIFKDDNTIYELRPLIYGYWG